MSHWWCCCCPYGGPPDCEAPVDGTVTWFSHEVDEDTGEITRVDHEESCFTFYVDSLGGDQDETGDGTEGNPWVNLRTAFGNQCIRNICSTPSCPKVKLRVKGVIDYYVTGTNYHGNLVVEPWHKFGVDMEGNEVLLYIDISYRIASGVENKGAIRYFTGCNFKRVHAFAFCDNGVGSVTTYAVHSCTECTFDDCYATASSKGFVYSYASGFHLCANSAFDDTGANPSAIYYPGKVVYAWSYGALNCVSSTFRNCEFAGYAYPGGWGYRGYGHGFYGCHNSTFDGCTGTGRASNFAGGYPHAYAYAYGFYRCNTSIIRNCSGLATAKCFSSGNAYAYGFHDCESSVFNDCTGTGNGSNSGSGNNNIGVGFNICKYSTLNDCHGAGEATGSGCKKACGFRANCSVFCNCTTSDRICEDCTEAQCDAWVCDVLDDHLLPYEETIEGVLKLDPEHSILDIRETIEGVLKLEVTHSFV